MRKKIGQLDSDINSVNFKDVFMGSIISHKIKIYNTTEDTIYISYPKENVGIKLDINPYKLPPTAYGELVLHFDTKKHNYGKISEEIFLQTEINGKDKVGKIFLKANIIEDFSTLSAEELAALPQISIPNKTIILQNLKPDVLRTEEIEIKNLGSSNLYIRNIQTFNKTFTVEPTSFAINPGSKKSFHIRVTPAHHSERIKTSIAVISNDPNLSVLNITVIGEVDLPVNTKNSMISEISIEKAEFILKSFKGQEDFVILDVRTEEEYKNGCIKNAVNLNFEDPAFVKMLKLFDTEKIYLVYCKSGYRSRLAIELMSNMNFKKIYHMFEGIDGWKAEHLELNDPNKLTD